MYIYICIYVYICVYPRTYREYTHTYIYIYTYVDIYIYIYIYVCVCMHVCRPAFRDFGLGTQDPGPEPAAADLRPGSQRGAGGPGRRSTVGALAVEL